MNKPKISMVVPAFNEPSHVMRTSFDSISAQSFGDFECLVIDESTDSASATACRELCARDQRFVYIHPDSRLGLPGSLNLGIAQARGDLIARFDSDDICMSDRLEQQVAFMSAHSRIGVLGGGLEIIDEAGQSLAMRSYPTDHATIERRFQTTTSVAHPTVILRRELIERHGGYDPGFRFAEDLDLWLRLLNCGVLFANLDRTLVRYRQQNTRRNRAHWHFNRRARIRNMSARHLPRRLLGVCAVSTWSYMPTVLQEQVFKALLLKSSKA